MPASRARTTRKGRRRSWRSASRSSRAVEARAVAPRIPTTSKEIMAIDATRPDLIVGVIGTGAMGRGIAKVTAAGGVQVFMDDSRPGADQEGGDSHREVIGAKARPGV